MASSTGPEPGTDVKELVPSAAVGPAGLVSTPLEEQPTAAMAMIKRAPDQRRIRATIATWTPVTGGVDLMPLAPLGHPSSGTVDRKIGGSVADHLGQSDGYPTARSLPP